MAARIRREADVASGAVGFITESTHEARIIDAGAADVVLMARECLRDPYFPRRAAQELGVAIDAPVQYQRAWSSASGQPRSPTVEQQPMLIEGRVHDLGDGFNVRRLLPVLQARHVGPFVFFDYMGPVTFLSDKGLDVRPHPHIGLATVTWLFEGVIRHRDSLGSIADIRPGEVNWMTSGRGIVHSERTPPEARGGGQRTHGIQVWVALPQKDAEVEPEFHHHGATELPRIDLPGAGLVLIAGTAYGQASPVKVFAPMFFIEATLEAGAELPWPEEHIERGICVVEGDIEWDGLSVPPMHAAVQTGPTAPPLRARSASRVMLFGGAPLDGERHLWWNFVSSSRERIEQAKADWVAQRMGTVIGDDKEYIPLPE